MKVEVPVGKYVVAVSGGVDSMALLDLLAKKPGVQLVVAHFNHGIRKDSNLDEVHVKKAAERYGYPFEVGHGNLGPKTSEQAARDARYEFLEQVKASYKADSIITAHHQDDLVETAFINLLRGTGRKGLVAIASNKKVVRPLLIYAKKDIYEYATAHEIKWREDSTNGDENYLRNYVRKHLLPNLSSSERGKIIRNIEKVAKTDNNIDNYIATLSQLISIDDVISRGSFVNLPFDLGNELIVYWLRQNQIRNFDKKTVNRLNIALKTAKTNSSHPVQGNLKLLISAKTAKFSQGA